MIGLREIAVTFATLSLVAIGGATAVVPELHRQVVGALHWMDDATFVNLFAIAQAAPGPNVLVVSLIGWHMAGWAGLAVATLAMLLPSSLLAFGTGRFVAWSAARPWLRRAQEGLVPIAIGLILASGLVMARAADHTVLAFAITGAATLFVLRTARNPLWALAAGAVIALVGARLGVA
jgi:chromate transporter